MRIKVYIFVVVAAPLFVPLSQAKAQVDSKSSLEYKIKGAFLYNFIKFVDWPKERIADSNEPITIGIIGKDPFGKAFEPIKNKKVKNKKVVVKRFKGLKELKKTGEKDKTEMQRAIEAVRKCHLLFVCSSEENVRDVTNLVKGHNILTVGDIKGFLESGGIINFLMEEKKVRFEINLAAAKQAKLKIRSQLLRLAKRVVKEKGPGGPED